MTQPHENDPRELLGGYATGTLSEEEKARLFRAALEDQALFNALADEEALRELLAEPGARQRLLEALGQPRIVPLWRRPAMLSVAAGLMLLVTSTVLLRRQPRILESTPPKAVEGPAKAKGPELVLDKVETAEPKRSVEGKPDREGAAYNLVAVPEPAKGESEAQAEKKEALREQVPPEEPLSYGGTAPGAGPPIPRAPERAPAPSLRLESTTDALKAEEAPAAAREDQASRRAKSVARLADELPFPLCTLERLPEGRHRLKVRAEARKPVYVLRREGGSVTVLKPVPREESEGPGLVYEFSGGGVLDVYLLQEASPNPEQLPAEGPVKGQRKRIPLAE